MDTVSHLDQTATTPIVTFEERHQRALDRVKSKPHVSSFVVKQTKWLETYNTDSDTVDEDDDDYESDDEVFEEIIALPSRNYKPPLDDHYSGIMIPLYTVVEDCERQLAVGDLSLQRGEEGDMWTYVNQFLIGKLSSLEEGWLAKWIENFTLIKNMSKKCVTTLDYYDLIVVSYRLTTGKVWSTMLSEKIQKWLAPEVQALDPGEALRTMRMVFDGVNGVGEAPLVKKLVSLYSYMLTQGLLERVGITLSDEDYSRMEQRAFLSAYSSKRSFVWCVADTTLFIAERLHEFYMTGDITAFLHSETAYAEWLKEADRLIHLAPFVGNLQAHNTSYFTFLSNLRDAIDKGQSYSKYVSRATSNDRTLIQRKLNSLELIQNVEITRKSAQKERPCPLGVLVAGCSSIAKSSFTKILFNYYGALHDLDRGDEYRYVRSPTEEFWTNFDSSKWCIQLDDIAFRDPSKCTDIDPTLADLLNIVNNVPYVPPQAALEDKGKTPVLAELVIATTNSIDLHADDYFSCPLAVRRRLPYVVSLVPKAEYMHENQVYVDPKKIPTNEGEFLDLWNITVSELSPIMHRGKESAELKEVAMFSSITEFLQHFGKFSLRHKENQKKAIAKDKDMLSISVCKQCFAPQPCSCMHVQVGYVPSSVWTFFRSMLKTSVDWVARWRATMWLINWSLNYQMTRYFMSYILECLGIDDITIRFYGGLRGACANKKLQRAVTFVSLLGLAVGAYYAAMQYYKPDKKRKTSTRKNQEFDILEDSDEKDPSEDTVDVVINGVLYRGPKAWILPNVERVELPVQGNVYGTTEKQLAKEESSNVWYNPTIELSTFDVPKASASLANAGAEQIRDIFSRNCVSLFIRIEGEATVRKMRAVFVKGHLCVTNGHAFKNTADKYTVDVVRSGMDQALTTNLRINLQRKDISFSNDTDLCVFQVDNIAPFKDISKFWSKTHIEPSSALELLREEDGSVTVRSLFAVNYHANVEVAEMPKKYDIYLGTCTEETQSGDCGALAVATTPRGPIIIGIHMLGHGRQAGVLEIQWNNIESLLRAPCISRRPVVQAGDGPELSYSGRTRTLTEPHHKSLFRYLEKGVVEMYGSFAGFRPSPKSSVCATPLQMEFLTHYGVEVGYGAPAMKGWEPWRKNVIKMIDPLVNYDRSILAECVDTFVADIIQHLPEHWEGELVELSDRAAVNGLPGVKFIDRLNASTSMGAPWGCSKKKFIVASPDSEYPDGIDFVEEVWVRVRAIEACYKDGKRAYPVATGHLKDEATPLRKIQIKKTRLFTGMPVDWSIVVRKKLLSFVRLVQKNKYVFEACPGTVAQSAEWGVLRDYLTHFGEDQIIGGDYGSFDKKMLAAFVLSAFEIIVQIHRAAGYSEEELREIMCIGEDTAFPLVDINGDLVMFYGTNPSGHPLTVIINSLVNALYMRYCYRVLNPAAEVASFKKSVHLMTYGDDNGMGVSTEIPWFNHTAIQTVLADIGVEYTMADKESESVPYIHINDFSFLKRRWVWNEEIKNWACPLEEESIIKSLTVWVPSGSIDKYKQMIAVIASAVSEYFFYGRERFEKERAFLMNVVSEEPYSLYVTESTFPTYDQLVERFHRASAALGSLTTASWVEIKPSSSSYNWFANNNNENKKVVGVVTGSTTLHSESKDTQDGSIKFLVLQSGDVTVESNSVETSEVMTFVDNSTGEIDDSGYVPSSIATSGSTLNTSLQHFLKRPTLIDQRTWTTASTNGILGSVIEPWFLFLNNSVIKNKLQNYAFLRAKLCMKFVVNATPFHYGMMRVAYEPNINSNNTGDRISKLRSNPVSTNPELVTLSQMPGTWIIPADNSGGEIHVPFFRYNNWLPLTSAAQAKTMGALRYYVAFPLSVATTSGSTSITIDTFAWLEDVELNGSTAELTLQAKDSYDGPISHTASAIAKISSRLNDVPVIGRFARATQIGASAIADIASMFGFTNTPIVADTHGFVPLAAPHLSSCEISTPIQKLTLDPKQELSIDPTMHGLSNVDEMSLKYITSKKSALVMDGWSTSDAIGTVLFNARVSPALFSQVSIMDGAVERGRRVYNTPLSYVSALFTHWRGDIIFEFEVVCTKFHKGRLKITWDPLGSQGVTPLAENSVFTTILDIGETNKASFRVPFHQAYNFLRLRGIDSDNWTVGNALAVNDAFDNGMFIVSVLTPLMSPVSPQNVGILISVRGAENLEFANPKANLANSSGVPPSFFAVQSADVLDMEGTTVTFGDEGDQHPNRYDLNFGERIVSLRALLHRQSLFDVSAPGGSASTRFLTYLKSYTRFLPMFGYDPAGMSTANRTFAVGGSYAFNWVQTHPMTYVAMMYGGFRGSVNYTANITNDIFPYVGDVRLERITNSSRSGDRMGRIAASLNDGTTTPVSQRYVNFTVPYAGTAGTAITNSQQNGMISWNMPMMTGVNFQYTDPTSAVNGNTVDQMNLESSLMHVNLKQVTDFTASRGFTVTTYAGSGPDYTCLWWICCPTIDYYSVVPTAP